MLKRRQKPPFKNYTIDYDAIYRITSAWIRFLQMIENGFPIVFSRFVLFLKSVQLYTS